MKTVYNIKSLFKTENLIGKKVTIKGWVKNNRKSKNGFSFISINDGSQLQSIQVIAYNKLKNYDDEITKLTKDCSIKVQGTLILSIGKEQSIEIRAEKITVYGWIENPENYPVTPKYHSMEHLRKYAHLRIRTNIFSAIARIRHNLAYTIHDFFHKNDFLWINTPIITSNDCEGAGDVFHLSTLDKLNVKDREEKHDNKKFFGKKTFLTVSGQLNAESYCLGVSKVYTFGPTFRAENSNTSRHLAEFWMIEPEMAFTKLKDNAIVAEKLLKFAVHSLIKTCSCDIEFLDKHVEKGLINKLDNLINKEFIYLTYDNAIKILGENNKKFEYDVKWGVDLQSEHERFLCEKYAKAPTIITDYPKIIKPFYMRVNDDEKTVAAMDIIVEGIGEIIGGGQREERLKFLDKRMQETNVDKEKLSWYRDLRKYGSVPHSGFGMGFERLLSYVAGIYNLKDVIPFPRTPGNANF